jgi:hypothetical protein
LIRKEERWNLCAAQHHPVEKDFELFECNFAWSIHPMLLNGRQNLVIPEAGLQLYM